MSGPSHVTTPLTFVVKAMDGVGDAEMDEELEAPLCSFSQKEETCTFSWKMSSGVIRAFQRNEAALTVIAQDYPLERSLDEFFPGLEGMKPRWDGEGGAVEVEVVTGTPEPGDASATVVLSAYSGWLTSGEMDVGIQIASYTWVFVLIGIVLLIGVLLLVVHLKAPPKLSGLTISAGESEATVFNRSSKATQTIIGVARLQADGEGNLLVRRESGNRISITPKDGAILQRASGEKVEDMVVVAVVLPGGKRLRVLQQLQLHDGTPLFVRAGVGGSGGSR